LTPRHANLTHTSLFGRWSKWFVVLALVLVTGGHWALLQSAAWVGMAVTYSQTDTVSVAFKKTFGGEFPCELCKLVKQGKAADQEREMQKLETKFDFFANAGTRGLFPPKPIRHFQFSSESAPPRVDAPILPPPRAA
jgi:hypothetical protein